MKVAEELWQVIASMPNDMSPDIAASFTTTMTEIRARAAQGKGPTLAADVMTAGESEFFITHMQAFWDLEAENFVGRKYFRADGSILAQTAVMGEEEVNRMREAGELDSEGVPKQFLGGGKLELSGHSFGHMAEVKDDEPKSALAMDTQRHELRVLGAGMGNPFAATAKMVGDDLGSKEKPGWASQIGAKADIIEGRLVVDEKPR